jgi:thiol-disulfide isomerase/thioredoxin
LLLGAGLGFALLGFVSQQGSLPGLGGGVPSSTGVGNPAPDFELEDLNQKIVRLSQAAGQPVVINFWATWCGPCLAEMPLLEEAFLKYASEALFLAVNFDEPQETVAQFVKDLKLTLPVVLDPGGMVADLYRVHAFPTTIFIDRQGVIQVVHLGSLSERQLENYLVLLGVQK